MNLPSSFATKSDDPIGEIWFEHEGEPFDILIMYLFTSEKLSIQVHPSDELAVASGLPSGKEECWLVLDAEPGAKLGIGIRQTLSAKELRAAALDGSLEDLVDRKPVSRRDFYYIPAGTVHVIGLGDALIESQQNEGAGTLQQKTLSNAAEVEARAARVWHVGQAESANIRTPECEDVALPFAYALIAQMLAYHAAIEKGTVVYQPCNLAKSVTVE